MLGGALVESAERLAEISVKQMNVGIEREARRMVAEPTLYLDGVASFCKQPARNGMAERVEAGPPHPRFLHRRAQNPRIEVVGVKRLSLRVEHESVRLGLQ